MAQFYEIKINEAQLDAMLAQLHSVPKALPRVLRNAVNDTAKSAQVEIAKKVAKSIKVKQSTVKSRINIKKATLKNLFAWIRIKDRPMSLLNFGARQTDKGVSFRGTDGKRILQERAFIGKGGNDGFRSNVWVRMKKGEIGKPAVKVEQGEKLAGVKLVSRKPLQKLVGPSVAEMYNNFSGFAAQVISKAQSNLNKNLQRHINLVLGKKIIMNRNAA